MGSFGQRVDERTRFPPPQANLLSMLSEVMPWPGGEQSLERGISSISGQSGNEIERSVSIHPPSSIARREAR